MKKASELRKELMSNPNRPDAIAAAKKWVENRVEYALQESPTATSTAIYNLDCFPCDGYHGLGNRFDIEDEIVDWLMDLGYSLKRESMWRDGPIRHIVSW